MNVTALLSVSSGTLFNSIAYLGLLDSNDNIIAKLPLTRMSNSWGYSLNKVFNTKSIVLVNLSNQTPVAVALFNFKGETLFVGNFSMITYSEVTKTCVIPANVIEVTSTASIPTVLVGSGSNNSGVSQSELTALVNQAVASQTLTLTNSVNLLNANLRAKETRTVFNVKDYGAIGDGFMDDTAAINTTIRACPEGGIVYFPAGIYRVSSPIVLKRNRTYRGSHSPKWYYRGGAVCSIKPNSSFVGDRIVYIPDKEITGESLDNDGGRLENISIDGDSFGSALIGLQIHGLVRDWKISRCDVSQTSGNGVVTSFYMRGGTTQVVPRGLLLDEVSVYSAGNSGGTGNGFSLSSMTDSTAKDCLAVGCEAMGWSIFNAAETKFVSCRAVFNKSDGFSVDGSIVVGGVQFIGCSTDRNGRYGVRVTATGTQPVQFIGLLTRRDGSTTSQTGAGFGVVGTSSAKACPVTVLGLDQTIGVDDDGGGNLSPLVGVEITHGSYVSVQGTVWGVNSAFVEAGTTQTVDISRVYQRTGANGNTV